MEKKEIDKLMSDINDFISRYKLETEEVNIVMEQIENYLATSKIMEIDEETRLWID